MGSGSLQNDRERAREMGRKGKRGPTEITKQAKEIIRLALEHALPEVQSALTELREEDTHKYLSIIEKLTTKVIPQQIEAKADINVSVKEPDWTDEH